MKQKCAVCYQSIKPDCDWNQGRCPHLPASITADIYKARYYNLIQSIKNLFKRK